MTTPNPTPGSSYPRAVRPLRYSINITVDGCVDHTAVTPTEAMHRHSADLLAAADALLFGRVIYEMMEAGWREVARNDELLDGRPEWMLPFAHTIDRAPKFVVSDSLTSVDWNAELIRRDELESTVRELKAQPGNGIVTGGVTLPLALAELDLIDSYEFIVHPRIVGHGPRIFEGLSDHVDLRLVERSELDVDIVVLRYEPVRPSAGSRSLSA
ncbi:dihydrofolate reductase family protein [Gordonia aichiensis]|uniref:Bacterial bifunctional deaminase-reductase C-terminal domain-containing protein n=1 Tax=Gordonia aichiensis NBRC 108223 TaxID=1220583 RepID=L7KJV7_9ACTN|nr:dihydrofolate reductase family protein [Gordonia aichiensis]GAC47968.1 hypothetical protein GOACH_04_03660 [Gordonia aichiensis NBRC 108223]